MKKGQTRDYELVYSGLEKEDIFSLNWSTTSTTTTKTTTTTKPAKHSTTKEPLKYVICCASMETSLFTINKSL